MRVQHGWLKEVRVLFVSICSEALMRKNSGERLYNNGEAHYSLFDEKDAQNYLSTDYKQSSKILLAIEISKPAYLHQSICFSS
jgi:hypothetical protein